MQQDLCSAKLRISSLPNFIEHSKSKKSPHLIKDRKLSYFLNKEKRKTYWRIKLF